MTRPPVPRGSLLSLCLAMVCGFGGLTVRADDPIDPFDRQLLEALEGPAAPERPQKIIPRLIDRTRDAATRLQAGELAQTRTLQQQILDDLDALLEQSAPPASPPPAAAPPNPQAADPSSASQQDSSDSPDEGNSSQPGSADPNAAASQSQQRTTPGQEGEGHIERRLGLSTAAWGHLPPKVREQMRSAFSEEYLPQYDALVRRYYEALARRRSPQP